MFENAVKAPPLTGGKGWLNVDRPLTWDDLKGKVVLLDFWTFCCSDCMHLLPYLEKLEDRFAEELVVIGVHSGKFDNERSTDSIRHAMLRYGVKHPVVNDRSYALWESFYVREWPTLILVDPEGFIVKKVACSEYPAGKFDEPIAALIEKFEGRLNRTPLTMVRQETLEIASPLLFPGKVTTDRHRIVVSDTGNHRVLVADKQGAVIHVIGGNGAGSADGDFASCHFNNPQGVCVQGDLLYVADTENHLIRCADLKAGTVITIAGNGQQAAYLNGPPSGPARSIALSSPWDLACWKNFLLIAMAGTHQLWRLDLLRGHIELFAGTGFESLKDGPGGEAQLSQPSGLSVNNDVLFFVDSETSSVRSLTLTEPGFPVRTLSGKGLFEFGDTEGCFSDTSLQHPLGIAAAGTVLYVADSYNHKIKVFDLQTGLSRTMQACSLSNAAATLEFAEPGGLCKDGEFLYVADTNNSRIQAVHLTTMTSSTIEFEFPAATEPATRHEPLMLPNLVQEQTLQKCLLACGKGTVLRVLLSIGTGIHFNEDAPGEFEIRCDEVKGFFRTGTLNNSSNEIELPFLENNFSATLTFAFTVYVCGDDNACYVQSYRYFIPVETSDEHERRSIEIAREIATG